MTTITMKEVAAFLLGEAPLDGAWFGDTRPSEHGQFWWRKHLRDALSAPATAPEKTVKEIMEFVRHYAANTFSSATLEDKIRRSLATPATAQVLTPLQDGEKIYALWHSSDANDLDDFLDGWRHAEAFHGIKGGQAMTAITTKYRNPQMQRAFDGVLAADRAQRVPDADDILRVVCETDPADFNDKRNICISPEDLGDILRDALPSPTPTASKLHVWQAAEIERLKTESEERLKNAVALVAENEQLRKDAERYQWLAEYLVSDDESYDDAIVAATTVKEVDSVIDAAMGASPRAHCFCGVRPQAQPATAPDEQLRRDSERYRWLRSQHWSDGQLSVVVNAKASVRLGANCPSHELLDEAIDSAMKGKL